MDLVKPSLFASFDIETDGDNPLQHSMLSLGIALYNKHGNLVDTFYQNIQPQQNKSADPKTMENFWSKYPQLYHEVCLNQVTPKEAMRLLDLWLKKYIFQHQITWVAAPASFDWMFLKSYFSCYGPDDKSTIGFSCQCLHSLARGYAMMHDMNINHLMTQLGGCRDPHTHHHALSDAIYQGHCYMNLRHAIKFMTNHKKRSWLNKRSINSTNLIVDPDQY
jgi:DNA polymerase III epsilon subunit-like protein